MAYEPDFGAKVAGSHHTYSVHCTKTREGAVCHQTVAHETCVTCKMAPVPGRPYCQHCQLIVDSLVVDAPTQIARDVERLSLGTGVAALDTASRAANVAVRAPAAVATAAIGMVTEGTERVGELARETVATEDALARRLFMRSSTSKASGERIDCTTPAAIPAPAAGARADECNCLTCVVKETARQMAPLAGARADEPCANAAPVVTQPTTAMAGGEYTAAYRERYGLTRKTSSAHASPARGNAQSGRRGGSHRSGGRSHPAAAKSGDQMLAGTGFTYRCHSCSDNVYEMSHCKSCGAKVPEVYIEDALSSMHPSAAAKFGEAMLDGVVGLNSMFGL